MPVDWWTGREVGVRPCPQSVYFGLSPWWLRRMIPIIFRLIAAKRHICHGGNVRMNTVNLVGFVA
ncbi:MAG TPA: hypothetical protein VII01_08400 [Solirubrobacteraceae bacterium]